MQAPLDEIARRAGVGNATLYRHFPTRRDLIEVVFAEPLRRIQQVGDEALGMNDGGAALAWCMEQLCELLAADRGIGELLLAPLPDTQLLQDPRRQSIEVVSKLVERGQAQGSLRADLDAADVFITLRAMFSAVMMTQDISPRAWRRQCALFLEAFRPDPLRELPIPPLTRQQLARVLHLSQDPSPPAK